MSPLDLGVQQVSYNYSVSTNDFVSIFTVILTAGKLEPLVREETARCTQLGVHLGIPLPRLKDLERQSNKIEECFLEMCYQWLHNEDVDRKWCEVYEALEQQENRRLKAILQKKYAADTRGKVMCHCDLNITLLHTVELDLGNFTYELREMTSKWYPFGAALGISTTDLDIIEDEKGSRRYMINMLQEWMDNNEEVTWEELLEALRQIGNRELAEKLEEQNAPVEIT